mmetsp:Transcript_19968/g.50226  ORF Transcript_19968/g.50226 Transcript_19968/m.50226 type:complete len:334 (+) Transcript_19968:175-1176(+)
MSPTSGLPRPALQFRGSQQRSFPRAVRSALPGAHSRAPSSRGALAQKKSIVTPRRRVLQVSAMLPAPAFLATQSALPVLAAACSIPSLLGYWKREYTVSYGYAGAMALAGGFPLIAGGLPELAAVHAWLTCLYGVRLAAFLLWRQLTVPKFRDFVERIEERAPPKRWQRTPFIFSVALLYLGMAAPVVLSARYSVGASPAGIIICKLALGAMLLGGVIEAVGDFQKSQFKAQHPDRWVDTGLYAWLRHPNYTGEQLLWTGSLVAGLSCAFLQLPSCWPWALGAVLSFLGIQFVLVMATTSLEKKQQGTYGSNSAFQAYKASTWAGITFPAKEE